MGTWGVWRIMLKQKNAGFTLIELLAVIAIIGILAALVTVAAPRAIEKARITDVESDFNNIRTALATYYSDHNSYPPGYGYRRLTDAQITALGGDPLAVPYDTSIPDAQLFFLDNYMERIGQFKAFDLYDRFNNDSHDANQNEAIQFLEYQPVGRPDPANPLQYIGQSNARYTGSNNVDEVGRMLNEQGPYIYIPVDTRQAKRYLQYCNAGFNDSGDLAYLNAGFYDPADGGAGSRYLGNLSYPPPRYDAFVLISVGPAQHVNGLLPTPLPGQHPSDSLDAYHIMGLRAYFLATRDQNVNGLLDFDFRARTRQNENMSAFDPARLGLMPDGTGAQGPLIYVQSN